MVEAKPEFDATLAEAEVLGVPPTSAVSELAFCSGNPEQRTRCQSEGEKRGLWVVQMFRQQVWKSF